MKIAIIDSYDSFTFNLSHLFKELGAEVDTFRNDLFELSDLECYDRIVLSPGPGIPSEAGKLMEALKHFAGKKPILGVCLGHQAIGEAFGGRLVNLSSVFHGIQSPCRKVAEDVLFNGLDDTFDVGRYHSWVVDEKSLPDCLEVTAVSQEGQIMAMRHKEMNIRGIQFHPESVLTTCGRTMIENWITYNNKTEI